MSTANPTSEAIRKPELRALRLVWTLFIFLAALVAYYPALHGEFVWDDGAWTKGIEHLHKDGAGLWKIWTSVTAMQQYFPVAGTSFWLDYHAWGFWTLPYHVENVVLHVLAALLLWRLLLCLEVRGAWLAAGIFALHPVMVESAGWIAERKNVLSLPLLLGAVLAYGRFVRFWREETHAEPRPWGWYALSVLLFLLAMLTKISAACFPAVVLVLAWWKQGRLTWKRDILPVAPLLIPSVLLGCLISWLEKHHLGAYGPEFEIPWTNRLLVAGQVPWFYAAKLLWPGDLCFHYASWKIDSHTLWQWLFLAATLLIPLGAWFARGRIGRGPAAAVFLFLGILFPVMGFSNVCGMRFTSVADRWTYCPSLVVITLVAYGLATFAARFRWNMLLPAVAAVLLPVLGVLTWHHAADLKDADSLWGSILKTNPDCFYAWNGLGHVHMGRSKLEDALADFRKALSLNPNYFDARIGMGSAFLRMNRIDDAIAEFQQVLDVGPSAGGDQARAVLHVDLASAMVRKGNIPGAISQYEQALKDDSENFVAQLGYCRLLLQLGRLDAAFPHYCKSLELSSEEPQVQLEMGFLKQREYRAALGVCEMAVRLKPESWDGLADMAWMLAAGDATVRNGPRALQLAAKADTLSGGGNPMVLQALAAAQAETGQFDKAVVTAGRALRAAEQLGDASITEAIRDAKASYESRNPYRDPNLSSPRTLANSRR